MSKPTDLQGSSEFCQSNDFARLSSNEIEAANRAEATAILIRAGYRVYRPEADVAGEDLVLKSPDGELRAVQLKSRLTVDETRYGGGRNIWMLFPSEPFRKDSRRIWYLVPHDVLFTKMKSDHGHTDKWNDRWSTRNPSKSLALHLQSFVVE